ncbi:MAG: hypothetical protein GX050_05110 [Firmicutes bacterium]|nr:hypothetical protein [Bacillota bacterium]
MDKRLIKRENWLKSFIRKKRGIGYTMMLVPHSSGVARSIHIPFFVAVFFVLLFIANIYFLVRYPLRISEISELDRTIYQLNDVITRNDNDIRLIEPPIQKTEDFSALVEEHGQMIAEIEALLKSINDKKAGKL